jgi:hypothetical protein
MQSSIHNIKMQQARESEELRKATNRDYFINVDNINPIIEEEISPVHVDEKVFDLDGVLMNESVTEDWRVRRDVQTERS